MRNKNQKKLQFIDACYDAMYEAFYESFAISTNEDESFESRRRRISIAAANKFKSKMQKAFDILDDHLISCDVIPTQMVAGNNTVTGKGKLQ